MTENQINKDKRILITWANGFIWANLLRRLVNEWFKNIFLILRESSDTRRIHDIIDKVTINHVSLLDIEWLDVFIQDTKPEIIYHLAAAGAYIGRDGRWIRDLFEVNVMGTINLINACQKVWFDYFVNTGSNSEYGQKDHPMHETDMLEPNNDYGVTKAAATLYASYIWKKYELPIYTFRLFAVYGYYEDKTRLIPSLMLNYIKWISPSLSKPDSVRDYIFVEDVVDYYLNIWKISWNFGWIYNIGNGKQYSIAEVVETIKNVANSSIDPTYGWVTVKQNEPRYRLSDNTKTKNDFWLSCTSLGIGLKKSFEWYQNNQYLYDKFQ